MTRPICKFHTVVFSSIINPYFMLWVIFPIPDPATSFKKIHVPIRLAHRHSFNEQINHSDGYNGVITGFKYDNLHPNGAAKALAHSKKKKKSRQKLVVLCFLFSFFLTLHKNTWGAAIRQHWERDWWATWEFRCSNGFARTDRAAGPWKTCHREKSIRPFLST